MNGSLNPAYPIIREVYSVVQRSRVVNTGAGFSQSLAQPARRPDVPTLLGRVDDRQLRLRHAGQRTARPHLRGHHQRPARLRPDDQPDLTIHTPQYCGFVSVLSPAALAARSAGLAPLMREHLIRTPLVGFAALSEQVAADVLVKCEHLQRTGSFKARGGLAKVSALTADQRRRGVVTASSGNHGLGVAHALAVLDGRAIVFVPVHASSAKVAALRRFGVEIRQQGDECGASERLAQDYAAEHGLAYVSPYNDADVIAGQGTIGVEIVEQLDGRTLDAIIVSVGGGGLVSGVASVLKHHWPTIRVIGASPVNDAAMAASVRAGQVVTLDAAPTLSDGTAGSVEPGSITLPLCQALVDEWVLVDEAAIRRALRLVIDTEHQLVEGAAAVAVAAALACRQTLAGRRVGIVSCGANIAADTLAAALNG